MDAVGNLAYNKLGEKLPFCLQSSIFEIDFDRNEFLLEDMPKRDRSWAQRIRVSVIVFADMDGYLEYESNDKMVLV